MLVVATRSARALDEGADGDGPGTRPLAETVRDPAAEDALENATLRLAARSLPAVLATLTARELAVVRGRYGIGGDQRSLRELATELSLSAERVRQIEQIAIGKLRESCDASTAITK
jgi:DNA-directed RNA polymerase sigma subunit (sigma70/sigma32)